MAFTADEFETEAGQPYCFNHTPQVSNQSAMNCHTID